MSGAPAGFWLVRSADVVDGVAKFASQVPKVRKESETLNGMDHSMIREKLVLLLDNLIKHPDEIVAAESYVASKLRKRANGSCGDVEHWEIVTTLGRMDEDYIATFLMRHSRMTKAGLERSKVYDNDAVRQLFYFLLNATSGLVLPPECVSKAVFGAACDKRAAEVGNRLKGVTDKDAFDGQGRIKWEVIGAYELVWQVQGENKYIHQVRHRPTDETVQVQETVHITPGFNLEFPWSDGKARATCGPSKYPLQDLFGANAGPLAKKTISGKSKVFYDFVNAAVREEHEQKRARAVLVEQTADIGGARKKQRCEQTAANAREALKRRQTDMQNKRTIKLT